VLIDELDSFVELLAELCWALVALEASSPDAEDEEFFVTLVTVVPVGPV